MRIFLVKITISRLFHARNVVKSLSERGMLQDVFPKEQVRPYTTHKQVILATCLPDIQKLNEQSANLPLFFYLDGNQIWQPDQMSVRM